MNYINNKYLILLVMCTVLIQGCESGPFTSMNGGDSGSGTDVGISFNTPNNASGNKTELEDGLQSKMDRENEDLRKISSSSEVKEKIYTALAPFVGSTDAKSMAEYFYKTPNQIPMVLVVVPPMLKYLKEDLNLDKEQATNVFNKIALSPTNDLREDLTECYATLMKAYEYSFKELELPKGKALNFAVRIASEKSSAKFLEGFKQRFVAVFLDENGPKLSRAQAIQKALASVSLE